MARADCARVLRRWGAEGSILLGGREPDRPYERPPLSKGYLRGEEQRSDALAQPPAFYAENNIEVLTRTSAMKPDLQDRPVKLSDPSPVGVDPAMPAHHANLQR